MSGWPFSNTKPLKGAFDVACAGNALNTLDPNLMVDINSPRQVNNEVRKLETTNPAQAQAIKNECTR